MIDSADAPGAPGRRVVKSPRFQPEHGSDRRDDEFIELIEPVQARAFSLSNIRRSKSPYFSETANVAHRQITSYQ